MLIVVDGIDGSGKTTICRMLKEYFEKKGKKAILVKDFFYTNEVSKRIYEILYDIIHGKLKVKKYTLELLFASLRYENMVEKKADVTIFDRYFTSAFAYSEVPVEWLKEIYKYISKPDYIFVLDLDPEIAYRRIRNRDNKSVYENLDSLKKARERFFRLKEIFDNVFIIDASKKPEEVLKDIISYLKI